MVEIKAGIDARSLLFSLPLSRYEPPLDKYLDQKSRNSFSRFSPTLFLRGIEGEDERGWKKKETRPCQPCHVVFDTRPRLNDNTGGPVNCNFPIKMPNSPITRRKWTASIGFPLSSQRRDNLRLNSRLVPADHCTGLRVAPRPVIVAAVACSTPLLLLGKARVHSNPLRARRCWSATTRFSLCLSPVPG